MPCSAAPALGHEKRIHTERYFQPEKSKEDLQQFFEKWQDQPAALDIPSCPTLINGAKTSIRSVILGAEFVIVTPADPTFLGVAESVLGALEAFLATSDEGDLFPHMERTTIVIRPATGAADKPTFGFVASADGEAEILGPSNAAIPEHRAMHAKRVRPLP